MYFNASRPLSPLGVAAVLERGSVSISLKLRRIHWSGRRTRRNCSLQIINSRSRGAARGKRSSISRCLGMGSLWGPATEKIKVQRPRPSIPSVSQGGRRAAFLFRNLRQSASQNLSENNVAVLTAPSFLERFCEADWRNSETK